MKVKGLLLSMCAIAALASCSQKDDMTPAGGNAEEAKVTLRLEGDGVGTKAEDTDPIGTESKVNNLTVFFFNTAGLIVGSPKYLATVNESNEIATTTDAAQVVVIANIGSSKVPAADTKFDSVNSIDQLKKVVYSSISSGVVNQTTENQYMSGMGTVKVDGTTLTGNVTVALHYLSARIRSIKIAWKNGQRYGVSTTFNNSKDKWFTIEKVYLMLAQTNSYLLPANASCSSPNITTWEGSFTPSVPAWAGGVSWTDGSAWWPLPAGVTAVQTASYLVGGDFAASANAIENVLLSNAGEIHPWYTFENSTTNLTGLIVQIKWRSKAESTVPGDLLTKYFTLYFGEQKASETQPLLVPGKSSDIVLTLNGDFTPGGNAGGGGDDPTKPTVNANVNVSVTTASWTTNPIDKTFE